MFLRDGLPGDGTLVLIGGGEFSFGDTAVVDRLWVGRAGEGKIGFLPAASGSSEYGEHFAAYVDAAFEREVEVLPIYRPRDARRGKNAERISDCAAVYLGGGIADQLLETLADSPVLEALERKLEAGGVVVAIAAAAQAVGRTVRSLTGNRALTGLGWLAETVVEPNFEPAHDRRLRWLLEEDGVEKGFGLPAGSALFFPPDGSVQAVGQVFELNDAEDDLEICDND
ncbi:MAG: Type 1 glutamine amidotransferase-like domain-containing protein [Acidobacteriota bacterium]|nr:Type 1 glutamine amidotransferase-like domain-containing protein [Acidobacteriota bacterium]